MLLLPLFEEARRKAGFCFSGGKDGEQRQGARQREEQDKAKSKDKRRAKSLDPRFRGDDEQQQQQKPTAHSTNKSPGRNRGFAFQHA
jgi:hypothetical protein